MSKLSHLKENFDSTDSKVGHDSRVISYKCQNHQKGPLQLSERG